MTACTWMMLHLLRFRDPLCVEEVNLSQGSDRAIAWLYGSDSPLGEDDLRTHITPIWAALGLWRDRDDADSVLNTPEVLLPDLSHTIEAWHALLQPIAHRGETNWVNRSSPGLALETETVDPGGPLVVLTSAGLNLEAGFDLERAQDFWRGVMRVMDAATAMPGNVMRQAFSNPTREHDGFTVTLWRNDDAMTSFAYQAGIHKTLLAEHMAVPKFDRSSFTRTRAIRSIGTWEGVEPVRIGTA